VDQIHSVFSTLDPRVQEEAAIAKAEELRKKKEREEMAKKLKEERLRKLEEDRLAAEVAAAVSPAVLPSGNGDQAEQYNALALLPNQIESPSKALTPASLMGTLNTATAAAAGRAGGRGVATGSTGAQAVEFSDLQRPDQESHVVSISAPLLEESSSTPNPLGPHTSTPPPPPTCHAPHLASTSARCKSPPLLASSTTCSTHQRLSGSGRPESVRGNQSMQGQTSVTASSEGRSRRGSLSGSSFANRVAPEPTAVGYELG
jgi:hypothetical protein